MGDRWPVDRTGAATPPHTPRRSRAPLLPTGGTHAAGPPSVPSRRGPPPTSAPSRATAPAARSPRRPRHDRRRGDRRRRSPTHPRLTALPRPTRAGGGPPLAPPQRVPPPAHASPPPGHPSTAPADLPTGHGATAAPGDGPPVVVSYVPPVDAPVVHAFRPPAPPWASGNRGLEYDTSPGDPVRAGAAGAAVRRPGRRQPPRHGPAPRRLCRLPIVPRPASSSPRARPSGRATGRPGRRCLPNFAARAGDAYADPAALFDTGATIVELLPFEVPPWAGLRPLLDVVDRPFQLAKPPASRGGARRPRPGLRLARWSCRGARVPSPRHACGLPDEPGARPRRTAGLPRAVLGRAALALARAGLAPGGDHGGRAWALRAPTPASRVRTSSPSSATTTATSCASATGAA